MGLSCYCGEGDYEYGYYYHPPEDYSVFVQGTRKCHCESCGKPLSDGDTITEFETCEHDEDGEEVERETEYMCEPCSDLFFSLSELGFCITLGDNMRELAREYAEEYGHPKETK